MTIKNTFIGLILSISIGFSFWTLFIFYWPQNEKKVSQEIVADAIMEDVSSIVMDKQGKPKLKIVTPKMVHFTQEDMTELTRPEVTLYRNNSPVPWYIIANHGKATKGIDNVLFWDNVVIQHPADMTHPSTLIKTQSLLVHPNQQTAQTKDLITLMQPNLTVNGEGLFADMNTGDVKLLSQTKVTYVPAS